MKKILLLLFAIATLTPAAAQVSIIPKVGLTIANVSGDYFQERRFLAGQKSITGFTAGLGFNYPLSSDNFLSIQPEILYSQRGFAVEENGIIDYEGTYRLNYLDIPILVKINFGGEKIKAYVNGGPSIGFLLGGKVDGQLSVFNLDEENLEFTDNPGVSLAELDANRLEVGLQFGGGVGYAFGDNVLFADLRYLAGLTDFDRDEQSRNQVITISLGVQIPLK